MGIENRASGLVVVDGSYSLSNAAPLNEYVEATIQTMNRTLMTSDDLERSAYGLDPKKVVESLPGGMTESDFVGSLKLAMLTECATDSYASIFEASSKRFNQPWLGRFTKDFWTPDEYMHHVPFKQVLLELGESEAQLDREIAEARAANFEHGSDYNPIQATTFGIVQEDLTDNFHGLSADAIEPGSPSAAQKIRKVKRRESLHMACYRDMTALQLEDNPQLAEDVAISLAEFKLPGNAVAPSYQDRAEVYLEKMGNDLPRLQRQIVRHLHEVTSDPEITGRIGMEVVVRKKLPESAARKIVLVALNKFGYPGKGLVGEAILESVGLSSAFDDERKNPYGLARDLMRKPIVNLIQKSGLLS